MDSGARTNLRRSRIARVETTETRIDDYGQETKLCGGHDQELKTI